MTKYTDTGKKDTRSGFGAGLYEAGKADSRVVALTADLKGSLKMDAFANDFPERFIQCGIAESNMIGVAAGLAITGKIPFAGSFAEFVTGRVYDQIRQEVAYGQTNVKIAASHAGITLGEDGATHQTMEDIALMRALPGMVVINPCDYNQTKAATIAAAKYDGPVYLRFGRPSVPNFTPEDQTFEIGKAYVMNEGKDVTIIATGHLVWEALKAAEKAYERMMDSHRQSRRQLMDSYRRNRLFFYGDGRKKKSFSSLERLNDRMETLSDGLLERQGARRVIGVGTDSGDSDGGKTKEMQSVEKTGGAAGTELASTLAG